jgi:hypothetical protein
LSLSVTNAQFEAYELKTLSTSREKSQVCVNKGGPKALFCGLGATYTQELMETLPFLYMQIKGLNASTADLYLLPRAAG